MFSQHSLSISCQATMRRVDSYTLVLFGCYVDDILKIHCPKFMHSFIHLFVCLVMNDQVLFAKKEW